MRFVLGESSERLGHKNGGVNLRQSIDLLAFPHPGTGAETE